MYKTKYHVGNWPAYDRALVQRGDITVCAARHVRLYNPCGHRVHPANHSETIHDTTHSQISRGGTGHRASYRDVRRVCDSSRHHSAR